MSPMSQRLLRPKASGDPDALAYIAAVQTADGQLLEAGVVKAINDFVVGCKLDGIWPAMKATCILMGARTLSGALTPIKGTAPTNNNFVSGDYDRKTGLVGNGSTKFLNSNRNNNADPQDSFHAALWVHSQGTGNPQVWFGAGSATNETGASNFGRDTISGRTFTRCRCSAAATAANTATGLFGVNRSASASYVNRANKTDATITETSQSPANADLCVFSASTGAFKTNARFSFYSIGESLSLSLLDARVETLFNSIGAAI